MKNSNIFWTILLSAQILAGTLAKHWGASHRRWSVPAYARHSPGEKSLFGSIRGGSSDDDEERYSRQVYTLGARAHGLVRSATVYLDGPSRSGLVFECAKNLALSGIGSIVLVTSGEDEDAAYHSSQLDDLGKTFITGARSELGLDKDDPTSLEEILKEFLLRLNPSLSVKIIARDELCKEKDTSGILLCVDRPYSTQVRLNQISRHVEFSFVSVETAGVYGRTFCDFGPTFDIHDIDGETPLVVPLDRVEVLNDDERTVLIRAVSGERHDMSKGDEIQFKLAGGEVLNVTCCVTRVKGPELVEAKLSHEDHSIDTFLSVVNAEAASFSRLKQLELVAFMSLETATADAKENAAVFTPCDLDKSFDENRRNAVFSSFQALGNFVNSHHRLPNIGDWKSFSALAKDSWHIAGFDSNNDWKTHCKLFLRGCAAKFVPVQAIFGAVAAQECLKAASGLYNPIRQFLLYDCDEVVPSTVLTDSEEEICSTSGQAYIIGRQVEKDIQDKRLFVVGAGAIGCEILKNLSAMGVGTGKKGYIIVTDMDTIERSNLSRQLLFRDTDIGKFKSKAAQEAIHRMNPLLKMECHTSKVGEESHGPFDSRFWSKDLDVVLNALDNVEARLYMDGQCVANEKALVDAGTLGSKGNVQVVVPHQSESYGSSADPPEPAIPVCTLKNFPYSISHTIQWGRDMFDGLFVRRPKQGNKYAKIISERGFEELASKIDHDLGDEAALDAAKELGEDLSVWNLDTGSVRGASIDWAVHLAYAFFHDAIAKLLVQHPTDSLDEDGEPFWSGSRKVPRILSFDTAEELESQQKIVNENFVAFVKTTARLRIETVLDSSKDSTVTSDEAEAALRRFAVKPKTCKEDGGESNTMTMIRKELQPLSSFSGKEGTLNVAEFEKDDDSNGHVAFITAASNLRALCYGIPPADAMETRRVAGKIVPAMVTTTAFVSALSCIEYLKLVQGLPLDRHRNAFINLALPFFAFTAPLPAEEIPGLRDQVYTLWDRITIKEGEKTASAGGITLRRLLKRIQKKACDDPNIEVSTVAFGQFMIYANFLNEDDDELLDKTLWSVVQEAVDSGNAFDNEHSRDVSDEKSKVSSQQILKSAHLDLTVVVEDLETGEEVELPPIRVKRTNPNRRR